MIKIIKSKEDYIQSCAQRDELLQGEAISNSQDREQLELLSLLIAKYEREQKIIELPNPIDAIEFRMAQMELSQKDLIPYIGSAEDVSMILERKKELTLPMVRKLHAALAIPLEILVK